MDPIFRLKYDDWKRRKWNETKKLDCIRVGSLIAKARLQIEGSMITLELSLLIACPSRASPYSPPPHMKIS